MTRELDGLLQVSEAARRLQLSAQRLRSLADEGRIASIRTPFGRLFDPQEIERFRATRGPFGRYQAHLPAPAPDAEDRNEHDGAEP